MLYVCDLEVNQFIWVVHDIMQLRDVRIFRMLRAFVYLARYWYTTYIVCIQSKRYDVTLLDESSPSQEVLV